MGRFVECLLKSEDILYLNLHTFNCVSLLCSYVEVCVLCARWMCVLCARWMCVCCVLGGGVCAVC